MNDSQDVPKAKQPLPIYTHIIVIILSIGLGLIAPLGILIFPATFYGCRQKGLNTQKAFGIAITVCVVLAIGKFLTMQSDGRI